MGRNKTSPLTRTEQLAAAKRRQRAKSTSFEVITSKELGARIRAFAKGRGLTVREAFEMAINLLLQQR